MENEKPVKTESEVDTEPQEKAPKPRVRRKRATGKAAAKKPATPAQRKPVSRMIVFFRHGIAEDVSDEKADGERSLTTSGHDRTKRSARGLAKVLGNVDAILSSPLLRALQTALWVTKAYGGKVKVRTTDALLPDASIEDLLKTIRETEGGNLVLVGHEPLLTKCAANLLGAPEMNLNLRRAGCVAIRVDEEGRGTLEWMLAPRTLRGF